MRLAGIADIHGNLPALEAVLRLTSAQRQKLGAPPCPLPRRMNGR